MLSEEQRKQFENDGYLVVKNFLSSEKCDSLRKEIQNVIESNNFIQELNNISVFTGDENETRVADLYFLTSTDKIRPFLEKDAKLILENEKKKQTTETEDQILAKKNIFNKIGHALHALNPEFKNVTFGENVKEIFKSLGYHKPVVCQSMYIFKQPYIGGEVQPHQDGTYLYTEPLKIAGVWIALEDCTVENGCLYFIPGSHKGPLTRRFKRNPNQEEFERGQYLIYDTDQTKIDESALIPVPVKAGDAIIIDGLVIHASGHNYSPNSRHIYTFHVYESENAKFSEENWMEYNTTSFLPLYEN